MAEITDDDILETVEQLMKQLALTEDDRDALTLGIQRMVWPPSPHTWMHEGEHAVLTVIPREKGGWQGRLSCSHGCGRRWQVNIASTEAAVYSALTQAHEEYRTGRTAAVPSRDPDRHRVSFQDLFRSNEYVEVQDERLT